MSHTSHRSMTSVALPPVSVLICTRSRGDSVVATIESILANDYPTFSLLVLDQSDDDLTETALLPFRHDPHLTYLRSATKGLGAAHNTAIRRFETELIAITDDDCVVPVDWLREIVEAFRIDGRIGLIFGRVAACQYDTNAGYVPVFERDEPVLLTTIRGDLFRGLGIGACFALKRSAWQVMRGFDEKLGPGAPLGSLEDRDMGIRLLLAGYFVYYTPRVAVTHYGFRRNRELRGLSFRDWFGFGAGYAKYLKCGHWSITPYMLRQMWIGQALGHSFNYLRVARRLGRVTPVLTFWLGFVAGLAAAVDRDTTLFKGQSVMGEAVGGRGTPDGESAAHAGAHARRAPDRREG